jgi:hypothetical protein
MLVHREHLLGLFVSLLTFYRKGALFSIPFGFYWIINTPGLDIIFLPCFNSGFLAAFYYPEPRRHPLPRVSIGVRGGLAR